MFKKIMVVMALLICNVAVAGDEYAPLIENLSAFKRFEAAFVQESLDEKGQLLQSLSGQLIIEKPHRFFWQADEPAAQRLVCDGETIWHYDEDLEQVIVQKYADKKGQSPLLLILEDAAQIRQGFDVEKIPTAIKNATSFRLQTKMRDSSTAVDSIVLTFANQQLLSLSFVDVLKQKTSIHFSDIRIDHPVDKKLFTFIVPVDADVLYD